MIKELTILYADLRKEGSREQNEGTDMDLASKGMIGKDLAKTYMSGNGLPAKTLSKKDLVKKESAWSRKLTAAALSLHLGRVPSAEDLEGEVRAQGAKPYFPNFPDFCYNISHSDGLVVCAAWNQPVGIDLQKIPSDTGKAMRIAKRFFSPQEQEALRQLQIEAPEAMLRLFTRCWTARESYIKLIGKGLAEPFEDYFPDLSEGLIHTKSGETFCLTACRAPEGYCMTVCSHVPILTDDILYQSVL